MDLESRIIQRLNHVDDRIDIDESNLTPIQEFYKDAKIFVTGTTGFLGQLLVEKLLRSCPISTLYVLVRSKKGKDTDTRLKEIFDDQLFNRMKKVCPNFRQKIVAIEGDCILPDLGLSTQNRKLLIDEVDIVFHIAATVRFDEKLTTAAAINVRATKELSLLVRQMPQLKSFVHVSTAYTNCIHGTIEEKVYAAPMEYSDLIKITETVDEYLIGILTPHFLGNYPNTYVYSKQIAENVIKEETRGLPVGIFRPSIVVSTYREPVAGWINNVYGATGIIFGASIGLLRVMYADGEKDANIVPADMCINGLIASAWDTATRFKESKEKETFEVPVYNYESTNDSKISWNYMRQLSFQFDSVLPTTKCIWVSSLSICKSYHMYLVMHFFLHIVPGILTDAFLFCKGKKMRMVKAYKKIHTFISAICYFSVTNFDFKSLNIQRMVARMSKKDREIFFCDLKKLNWEDFFISYVPGARVYLAKDPLETVAEAKIKYNRFIWADRILKTTIGILLLTLSCFIVGISHQ